MSKRRYKDTMQIEILLGISQAHKAEGLIVVIDVFRAFSTACYLFGAGANRVFPVATLEEAYELRKRKPQLLLAGEREGKKPDDFDMGNSPSSIVKMDLQEKDIVFTTSLGTKGLTAVIGSEEILTGAFVNAGAIVSHVQKRQPACVSFVCTGSYDGQVHDEDLLCARYLENELMGRPNDFQEIVTYLREKGPYSKRFFDEACTSHPREDFDLCLDLDRFDFIVRMVNLDGARTLIRE